MPDYARVERPVSAGRVADVLWPVEELMRPVLAGVPPARADRVARPSVIPAQAGIQDKADPPVIPANAARPDTAARGVSLDPRFRGGDESEASWVVAGANTAPASFPRKRESRTTGPPVIPAQWARATMVKEGLLKADALRGVWEISDAGRRALADVAPFAYLREVVARICTRPVARLGGLMPADVEHALRSPKSQRLHPPSLQVPAGSAQPPGPRHVAPSHISKRILANPRRRKQEGVPRTLTTGQRRPL